MKWGVEILRSFNVFLFVLHILPEIRFLEIFLRKSEEIPPQKNVFESDRILHDKPQ
jgi:hypothetical protein